MKNSIFHPALTARAILLSSLFQGVPAMCDSCPTPSFHAARSFDTGLNPPSVATGDFNGDGKPDLAVANSGSEYVPGSGGVSVLLGNGDGSFQAIINYQAGTRPASIALGDFNGDGKLDLAVADAGYPFGAAPVDGSVSVLLGNVDGTFQAAVSFSTGQQSISVAVADFNGDDKLDLAVANIGDDTVSVLLGKGDGTFQPALNSEVEFGPRNFYEPARKVMSVGDFSGDGKADLAVVNDNSGVVSVLLGKGDGTFLAPMDAFVFSPGSVTVGDLNGDGKLDLAVGRSFYFSGSVGDMNSVSVLLGEGDGTFKAAVDYITVAWFGRVGSVFVTVSDFNGDDKPDLAVANGDYCSVSVLLGKGNGSFQAAVNYDVGRGAYALAVDDLNRDGKADLVVGGLVLLGKGDGTFQAAVTYGAGWSPSSVAVGDFNGDGKTDLAVANSSSGNVSMLMGKGDGTFQTAVNYAAVYYEVNYFSETYPFSVAVADFNGDGKADLAVTDGGVVSLLLGKGGGTFQAAVTYRAGWSPGPVAVADFNCDGKPDLAVGNRGWHNQISDTYPNSSVSVLLGTGDGAFQAAVSYDKGESLRSVAVGDFNRDGKPDLAVAYQGHYVQSSNAYTNSSVSVLLGKGDGTFQAAVNYDPGKDPYSIAVGDFNGDSNPDLAVAISESISVLLGEGDGAFRAAVNSGAGALLESMAVGDFNGDGKLNLAGADIGAGGMSVLLGSGDGSFPPAVHYPRSGHSVDVWDSYRVDVGDFNGDGKPDLAAAYPGSTSVSVLLNTCGSAGPELAIVRNGSTIKIFWPSLSTGLVLESTPSLGPPSWQLAVEVPTDNNGRWEVSTPSSQGQRYFRLHKP